MDNEISVIDYEAANIGSVLRMLEKAGGKPVRASTPAEISAARRIILPGVGAFDHGMSQLHKRGLVDALNDAALVRRIPVMGICLGMQLMCRGSEEGGLPGLGWMDASVEKFQFDAEDRLPVPHMGWNTVRLCKDNPLLPTIEDRTRFYFVHSYKVRCDREDDVIAKTHYGVDFDSVFSRGNLFGAQFHPEKSHRYGMQLLFNFLKHTVHA
ncbi:imidazole glycerol phosphate synthase subunit HisH [Pelomonas aquatica]|nr:imidazole glycerol phosphate synthase subunit HisH [Pelomonas aquatica]